MKSTGNDAAFMSLNRTKETRNGYRQARGHLGWKGTSGQVSFECETVPAGVVVAEDYITLPTWAELSALAAIAWRSRWLQGASISFFLPISSCTPLRCVLLSRQQPSLYSAAH